MFWAAAVELAVLVVVLLAMSSRYAHSSKPASSFLRKQKLHLQQQSLGVWARAQYPALRDTPPPTRHNTIPTLIVRLPPRSFVRYTHIAHSHHIHALVLRRARVCLNTMPQCGAVLLNYSRMPCARSCARRSASD